MNYPLPLITVIVPVYNVEKTLERCVNSIIAQSYTTLEIILVNDGSTDHSGEICDSYKRLDKRIQVIHKRNGGLSSARNTGIDHASGTYMCFIDSDDWIHIDYVKTLYDLSIKYNADISSCECDTVSSEIVSLKKCTKEDALLSKSDFWKLCLTNHFVSVYACNKLYRKELFAHTRYPEGRLYEDIVPMFQLIKEASIFAVTHQKLYYYFDNFDSISKGVFQIRDNDYIENWKVIEKSCLQTFPELTMEFNHRIIYAHFRLLNKLAITPSDEFIEYTNTYKDYLKRYFVQVIQDPYMKIHSKIQIALIIFNFSFYKRLYRKIRYR